jgi:hypothetical protein
VKEKHESLVAFVVLCGLWYALAGGYQYSMALKAGAAVVIPKPRVPHCQVVRVSRYQDGRYIGSGETLACPGPNGLEIL